MKARQIVPRLLIALISTTSVVGCGGDEPTDLADYTVSYRSKVRVPGSGERLLTSELQEQLASADPISAVRCPLENSGAFQKAVDDLGGVSWKSPIALLKDESLRPLYDNRKGNSRPMAGVTAADESTVTIERPDLIGLQNDTAVFLSQTQGLLAVDVSGETPQVSCALTLPGNPRNFLFKGNELVILVNGFHQDQRMSALLRFSFKNGTFTFIDSLFFPSQSILDARLFNQTVTVYTTLYKEEAVSAPNTMVRSMSVAGDAYGSNELGRKLLAVDWDEALSIDWEETFLNDPEDEDPLRGRDPSDFSLGDVVSTRKHFKRFISASDAYVVVSRDVTDTVFVGMKTQRYTVCTDYNPRYKQVEKCSAVMERRPNPDYVQPGPNGDYSCNGQRLEDCLREAAPKVSQFIYKKVGQECRMVWIGRCEKTDTYTRTYPRYRYDKRTEFTIYRYQEGGFHQLHEKLFELDETSGEDPDVLSFTEKPLALPGLTANKDQIHLQNNHLYVVSHADRLLHTLLILGNSVIYLRTVSLPDVGCNPAVSFSPDRLMLSGTYCRESRGSLTELWSHVSTVSLDSPSFPALLNNFNMPGTNTQLILANTGVVGPGSVSFEHSGVYRSLMKMTLFSRQDGSEIDNLLLGTEFDVMLAGSWLSYGDDQRIRLHQSSQRIFVPYSGTHHADKYSASVHRLNISHVDDGTLASEKSFNVLENIVRTISIDDARALAFGNNTAFSLKKEGENWNMQTIKTFFEPVAAYRVTDEDVYARIDRLGSRCRISLHKGVAGFFEEETDAETEIECLGQPKGIGSNVAFASSLTGWNIDARAMASKALDERVVPILLDQTEHEEYCYLRDEKDVPARIVDFLDEVPAKVTCERLDTMDNGIPTGVPETAF